METCTESIKYLLFLRITNGRYLEWVWEKSWMDPKILKKHFSYFALLFIFRLSNFRHDTKLTVNARHRLFFSLFTESLSFKLLWPACNGCTIKKTRPKLFSKLSNLQTKKSLNLRFCGTTQPTHRKSSIFCANKMSAAGSFCTNIGRRPSQWSGICCCWLFIQFDYWTVKCDAVAHTHRA